MGIIKKKQALPKDQDYQLISQWGQTQSEVVYELFSRDIYKKLSIMI